MAYNSVHDCSIFWKQRYLIGFGLTGIFIFLLIVFTQGVELIFDDPYSFLFIWCVFGCLYTYRSYVEGNLAGRVLIDDDLVEVILHSGKSKRFVVSDIEKLRVLGARRSINGFGVRELEIKLSDENKIHVPVNIKGYPELYKVLSEGGS